MSSKKARATISAPSKRTARLRDFPNANVLELAKLQPGSWFNAKQVEDAVTNLNEAAGNLGYAFADINPAYNRDAEKRLMNVTIKVGRNAARLCRAHRHHRQHHHARQGHPPRIPPQRGRCLQCAQGQAQPGPHPEPRLFPGQAGDQADRGLGPGPRRARRQCRGKADRPAVAVGRLFEPRAVRRPARGFARTTSWARASSSTPRSTGRAIRSRSKRGWADPYFLDKSILVGVQLFRRDYSSFNYIGNNRNTTYTQVSTGGGLRIGFPLTEYWNFGGRYTLSQGQGRRSTRAPSIPILTAPVRSGAVRPAQGRPLSLRRNRHAADLARSAISTIYDDTDGIHPTRGQRLTSRPGFRGSRRRRALSIGPRVDATKYMSFGGGWILSAHGEGGYIKALQSVARRPGRDAIRLTDRFFDPRACAASTFAASARGSSACPTMRTARLTDRLKHGSPTRSAAGPITWAGWSSSSRSAPGLKSLGLRPSAYVDVGLAVEHYASRS